MQLSLVGMFKNEARTIRRTLESCKPFVDRFLIRVDSSSEDDTATIAREVMGDLPGRVVEAPFLGYMQTRNWLLDEDAASVRPELGPSFQLMISGDEILVGGANLRKFLDEHGTEADCFTLPVELNGMQRVPRPILTRAGSDFRYFDFDCNVHEVACNRVDPTAKTLGCLAAFIRHETSDPDRKLNTVGAVHLPALAGALERDPTNARACEYLAQSYAFLGNYEPDATEREEFQKEAVRFFMMRLAMPFDSKGERSYMVQRFLDAAMVTARFPRERLIKFAEALCVDDPDRPEPALLRLLIAQRLDGISVRQIYEMAQEVLRRVDLERKNPPPDTAPRFIGCEWQARRFLAIATKDLARVNPARKAEALEHIKAGVAAGGDWAAFQPIAQELQQIAGAP